MKNILKKKNKKELDKNLNKMKKKEKIKQ